LRNDKDIADVDNEFKFCRYDSDEGNSESEDESEVQESDAGSDSDDSTVTGTEEKEQEKEKNKLGNKMIGFWEAGKKKLISDDAITAWMVSPLPDIMEDVRKHEGEHRNAVERVIKKWFSITVSCIHKFCLFPFRWNITKRN
jgi:hypothetical protein